nr:TPA_asm: P6 [Medicago trirhavirus 1]
MERFNVDSLMSQSKLPEIPQGQIITTPSSGDQNEVMKIFGGGIAKDALDNIDETEEIPERIENYALEPHAEDASVHTRIKLPKDASQSQLDRGLKLHGLNVGKEMIERLASNIKFASMAPGEIEVMALTIRACQDEYALSELKSSICEITSRLKDLTAELDDSSRKSKTVSNSLNQNLDLVNKLKEHLNTQAPISIPGPSVPKPRSYIERATEILVAHINIPASLATTLPIWFAAYLQQKLPQMSNESFMALQKQERMQHIQNAVNLKLNLIQS